MADFLQKELQHAVQHLHISLLKRQLPSSSSDIRINVSDEVDKISLGSFRSLPTNPTQLLINKLGKIKVHSDSDSFENYTVGQSSPQNRKLPEQLETPSFFSTPDSKHHLFIEDSIDNLDNLSSNGNFH